MRIHTVVAAAAVVAGLYALCVSPSLAHAYESYTSYSPIRCAYPTNSTLAVSTASNVNQLYDPAGTYSYTMFCPVDSIEALVPASSSSVAWIRGWANANGWLAYACVTYADGTGGSCGSSTSSGYSHNAHISVGDMSAWGTNHIDSYFLKIVVGAKDGSNSLNTFSNYIVYF